MDNCSYVVTKYELNRPLRPLYVFTVTVNFDHQILGRKSALDEGSLAPFKVDSKFFRRKHVCPSMYDKKWLGWFRCTS